MAGPLTIPPPDNCLLVPIDVAALLVTATTPAQAVPTETVIPFAPVNSPEAATLPQPPPLFGAPAARPPGVHLHWAMPDGLTRGDAGKTGTQSTPPSGPIGQPAGPGNPTGVPALPDRWVVVRLVYNQPTNRPWMLEADRGDHRDLAGWTEPGPLPAGTQTGKAGRRYYPREKLTAVAGADVAWAATYDAVLDRFAFYDDLAGVPTTQGMSYLVMGWWSSPALDPMNGLTNYTDYEARARRFGWTAPVPALIPPSLGPGPIAQAAQILAPTRTLLHGVVYGVRRPGTTVPDQRPNPDSVEMGFGGSAFAAFAALLGEGTAEQRAASERVIAAFSAGLLARVDQPDGLVAVDEDRHAAGFIGVSGGTRPTADRVADGDLFKPPIPTTPTPIPSPSPPKPGEPGPGTIPDDPTSLAPAAARLVRRDEHAVISASQATVLTTPESEPRTFRDVAAPLPRLFVPGDLSLVIRGAGRSYRHGGDGRFSGDGLLDTRLAHNIVRLLAGIVTESDLPTGLRFLGSTAVPPEADWLMREAVLTDPFRVAELRTYGPQVPRVAPEAVRARLLAEAVLRHAADGPLAPGPNATLPAMLRAHSAFNGVAPSPVGFSPWLPAWVPLWCEWEIALRVDGDLARWRLGPIELEPTGVPDAPGNPLVLRGRTLLTATTGRAFAGQVRAWLEEERRRDQAGQGQTSAESEATLAAAATAAEGLDLLTGTLRGVREELLGLDAQRSLITKIDPKTGQPLERPPARSLPMLLAGGALTIRRLRIVDAFGRFVDLSAAGLARIEVASTHRHPAGAPQVTLAPRFQRPARLAMRFVDPRTADGAAPAEARIDQEKPANTVSPVAGWLLPDHVDEALECFDSAGRPLGQLMHDPLSDAVVWEIAPGRPGPIVAAPDAGGDAAARHVARFAAGLIRADAATRNAGGDVGGDSALSALLRAIDTTLWTFDPLGSLGTAAVAGLVGRPIAVVRAVVSLEVSSDVGELRFGNAIAQALRARAYAELAAKAIRVRLGELTRTDDGLLAYVVDDDYDSVRLVAPDVRDRARAMRPMQGQLGVVGQPTQLDPPTSPITHPYVSGPSELDVHVGQTVRLTLLLHPGGKVHATSGLLPRKGLALARDWFHAALERLSPSFRVGPVLVDPTGVRMPKVTGLGDKQVFTRRVTPLTWRDDPILAATQTALLPDDPAGLQEGWIRVAPDGGTGTP